MNKVFPVGSLYLNINSTSPSSLFGGTWERLPEGYALWTATSGAGGTIAAGLPDIHGLFVLHGANTESIINNAEGAFEGVFGSSDHYRTPSNLPSQAGVASKGGIEFLASRGERYANDEYKNLVFGKSNTVQPPAYKIYAWKRIS